MTTRVLKELAVAVASYEDRATGQQKNRYKNIGVLMESTNERGEANTFLMLDRSFNPAGIPFKQGSDKILISMFDPRSQDGQQDRQQQAARDDDESRSQAGGAYAGGRSDIQDEVPF
jgi:hypothetical protein